MYYCFVLLGYSSNQYGILYQELYQCERYHLKVSVSYDNVFK